MAEGFLVTIIPLNASVVYRVSGRRGGRPDDQNYNVSMETYLLPEQCSLTKSLSGDEGDTDKTKATMFIQGEENPGEYYVKVQVLGPVTECGIENKSDPGKAYDFFAYEIQWARLKCLYWNETLEAWMADGCAISNQSSINSTVCHCNHLTAFGGDFVTPPNAMDFGKFEFSDRRCGFDNYLSCVPLRRASNGPFTSARGIQEGFCRRQPGDADLQHGRTSGYRGA
ncbi:polycystin-1-like protein 2 [Branchiostoma floridae x Branchiostoma belcheri]